MEDLYRLLRANHVQAQGIVDTVSVPLVVLDASLRVEAASRSFFDVFKVDRDETIGTPLYKLGSGQWDIPALRQLLFDVIPKANVVIDFEVQADFPHLGRRTMLVTARTLHHPDRASHTMLVSFVDATEQYRQDAARQVLLGELRHRIKNILGLARSLARQTSTEGRSAEEYRNAFLGRLGALTEAQDIAFADAGESGIAALLDRIFAPYSGGDRTAVVIAPGADVDLPQRVLMSLALVVHEMATNAAKYGALSRPGGQVHIEWGVEEHTLRLRWKEVGGPPVVEPTAAGYGTQLVESAVTYNLHGEVELRYAPAGLEADFVIPLADDDPRD